MPESLQRLHASFFLTSTGAQPVRDWLLGLSKEDRKAIGTDIAYVQYKWPIGRPRVAHLVGDIWEVRSRLANRTARVLFAVDGKEMVLLHGFIKKTQSAPVQDIELAKARWREWVSASSA